MKCDQCGKETIEGMTQNWIAGTIAGRSTYGAPTGSGTVLETTYDNFLPIATFLCSTCYEPRARKVRRNVKVALFLGLGGVALLILAFILFTSVYATRQPAWKSIAMVLAALVGFLLLKFAWTELSIRSDLLWKTRTPRELQDVLHYYASSKAKETGRDTVWTPEHVEVLSIGNERERLASLWEKGIITEDEYQKKKKEMDSRMLAIAQRMAGRSDKNKDEG
jgi:hypothetical protein